MCIHVYLSEFISPSHLQTLINSDELTSVWSFTDMSGGDFARNVNFWNLFRKINKDGPKSAMSV